MCSENQLQISFRFSALSSTDAEALSALDIGAKFGKHHEPGQTTAAVPLDNDVAEKIVRFVTEKDIAVGDTDIFMSLVTDYDTRIFDVPDVVNTVVRAINSKLTYSFTYVAAP